MSSESPPTFLALAALACGFSGYVLFFYVRSPLLPWLGLVLMLAAVPLGIAAIASSRRRLAKVLGMLAILPFAILMWAIEHWFNS